MLYRSDENKLFLAEHGAIKAILQLMMSKSADLQEAPLVALLSLFSHPLVPDIFLATSGGLEEIVKLLASYNDVIRELAVILLKALSLYQAQRVKELIPAHLMILMEKDQSIPTGLVVTNDIIIIIIIILLAFQLIVLIVFLFIFIHIVIIISIIDYYDYYYYYYYF